MPGMSQNHLPQENRRVNGEEQWHAIKFICFSKPLGQVENAAKLSLRFSLDASFISVPKSLSIFPLAIENNIPFKTALNVVRRKNKN
jgi:hypothetical protein